MGRSGIRRSRKDRRRQQRRHLDKVGEHNPARHEQHLEREAVADTMGLGGAAPWVKWTALVIGGLMVFTALVVFIVLL
jgi:hypothetical protein